MSDPPPREEQGREEPVVHCVACGHMIPKSNVAIHLATCHSNGSRRREAQDSEPPPQEEMRRCERCGHDIPVRNQVAHDASCRPTTTIQAEEEAIETIDGFVNVPDTASGTTEDAPTTEEEEDQWSCPRCTLLNPNNSHVCEVCLYNRQHEILATNNDDNVQVEVREMDPRVASAIGSTISVASWSLVGGLIGGPIGALVLGGSAAVGDGIRQFQEHRLRQTGAVRRPRLVITSTSVRNTPQGGSVLSMTSNVTGRQRTITIRSPPGRNNIDFEQMTPAERNILQMLLQNALSSSQGAAQGNQFSYEELLQQFGVGTDNRRGASPETIDHLPLTRLEEAVDSEHDVCNICLEKFQPGDEMRKLGCSHCFHKPCIDRWLSQVASCPICKREIEVTSSFEY